MQSIDLKNKNVLVTGGGQGIGAEICKTMAACGTNVLVNYHTNRDKAEALVIELKKGFGINAFAFRADVSDYDSIVKMYEYPSDKAAYITGTGIYIDGAYKENTIPYDSRTNK